MKNESKKLRKLIKNAKNILILTHKGPDFDAFCSALILKEYLDTKYPKKSVTFKARQIPTQNIPHMQEVEVVKKIEKGEEDLVIITDAGSWDMCITHHDNIQETSAKVVYIDHHDTKTEDSDLSINNNLSSATEQVLYLCMDIEGKRLKISQDMSILGQIGVIADTTRFLTENAKPSTYELMANLRKIYEFDIEDFTYKNSKFPFESLVPLNIYLRNLQVEDDMAYTYISKGDIDELGLTKVAVNSAQQHVRDEIIRSIYGVHWGFIIKPSYYKENIWQVSFRGTKGYRKVNNIAETLNGGGHEYSSAARVEANDVMEVVKIVLDAIQNTTVEK